MLNALLLLGGLLTIAAWLVVGDVLWEWLWRR